MANKVDISLAIKGVLDKYGLNRKYIANSNVSDTFDSVVQEVVTIQGSDAAGGNPTIITGSVTFNVGDVIYVENTSTQWPVVLYAYNIGSGIYADFSMIKAGQGIAVIATGTNLPQLAIEAYANTITVNLVVFRSSFEL